MGMITDKETNFVYLSEWTKNNFPEITKELTGFFKKAGIGYGFLKHTDDYYCRDYQPVQVEKDKFTYEYDFGDGWEHIILLEKILPPEDGATYPRCIKGKRACPPEDCGGIWGYAHLLEVIADPEDPEHDEMLEWLGGEFDSEYFNLDEVNERLRSAV